MRNGLPEEHSLKASRTKQFPIYATTKGLRAIPYIVLSNTSMNDASALYLSHILVDHHPPDRLLHRVPPPKAGSEQQQLMVYDETLCRGIIYLPNDAIAKAGVKVLALAERERLKLEESDTFNEDLHNPAEVTEPLEPTPGSTKPSGLLAARPRRRRASGSTGGHIGSSVSTSKLMSDLDRARSRIEGEELEKTGQYGNELWRKALIMLCLCREVQWPRDTQTPHPAPCFPTTNLDQVPDALLQPTFSWGSEFPPLPLLSPQKPRAPIVRTLEVPGHVPRKIKPLAPLLPLGNCNPNQAMSARSVHKRKVSVPVIPEAPTIIPPTPQPISPGTKIAIAIEHVRTKPYLAELPCGFSQEIWCKIIGQAAGAQGILSQAQQKSVLSWAMDRNTLRREKEWLCEKEGNQIWHVLDGMKCLAYEIDQEVDLA